MRIAYADPPYPGNAHLYAGHKDYAGEVDHAELLERLATYDGWVLHTSSKSLAYVLSLCPDDVRLLVWVNHCLARAWEPIIVRRCRPFNGQGRHIDWILCEVDAYQYRPRPDSYVIGAKPAPVCDFCFAWVGAEPGEDTLDDLFPGSGAVSRAWENWNQQPELPLPRLVTRWDIRKGRLPTDDWLTLEGVG